MILWLIRSAIYALYPPTDDLPGATDVELNTYLREFRRDAPRLMWIGLVLGAIVFTVTPIFTVYLPLPSFWLSRSALDRHASRIAYTRIYLIRQAVFVVKFTGGLCWGANAKTRAAYALPAYAADPGTWRDS